MLSLLSLNTLELLLPHPTMTLPRPDAAGRGETFEVHTKHVPCVPKPRTEPPVVLSTAQAGEGPPKLPRPPTYRLPLPAFPAFIGQNCPASCIVARLAPGAVPADAMHAEPNHPTTRSRRLRIGIEKPRREDFLATLCCANTQDLSTLSRRCFVV